LDPELASGMCERAFWRKQKGRETEWKKRRNEGTGKGDRREKEMRIGKKGKDRTRRKGGERIGCYRRLALVGSRELRLYS